MSEEAEPGPDLSPVERLIADGQTTLGSGTWDSAPPFPADPDGPSLSQILKEMRDAERW